MNAGPTIAKKSDVRGEGQLLQAMLTHWVHEDNLYWNQIRHLLVIQLTAFAAWFALGVSILAVALLLFAAFVSWRILVLADMVRLNRGANLKSIKVIATNLLSAESELQVRKELGVEFDVSGPLRFALHTFEPTKDAGRKFQSLVFGVSIALNIATAMVTVQGLLGSSAWLEVLHQRFKPLSLLQSPQPASVAPKSQQPSKLATPS